MYTDKEFADMMLLDAALLISFMGIGSQKGQNSIRLYEMFAYIGRLNLFMINRDMFLLENQIPFQILILLVNLRFGDEGKERVNKFLHESIWGYYRQEHNFKTQQRLQGGHQPLSLFDAFRKVLTWEWTPEVQSQDSSNEEEYHPTKRFTTYRSASDLKAKGIHFRACHRRSLEDIQFKSFLFYGNLKLPIWFVSDLSRVFFPNMIAYELCPGLLLDPIVISYVNFMKSLIDGAADVKVMRDNKILLTSLGNDEEVAEFYKGLNTYGAGETKRFKEVRRKIQMHYDSRAKMWMAQFADIYFSRPWTVIASITAVVTWMAQFGHINFSMLWTVGWITAVVLLALTAMQTHFKIYSPK